MTQTNNRFMDELAKLMTDAAGAAQGVQREEFEAVKEMAAKAREENDRLSERVAVLEAEIAALRGKV
jgi:BMFP domain-containing protein YqiC